MSRFVDELTPGVLRDAVRTMLGPKLGGGIGRQVFVYDLDSRYVVKIEDSSQSFQNIIEWELWHAVKDTDFSQWFAPAKHISPSGSVLLMERTLPAPRSKYPARMPEFLGDYKYSNYGLLRGRIVCHDYGSMWIASNGISKRMRKAKWWDAEDGSSFDDRSKT